MKLIIVGCEYSGTTTLANLVCDWAAREMGVKLVAHDHWKIPDIGCYPHLDTASPLTDLESKEILALSPKFKEMLQRQSTIMHLPTEDQGEDYLMVGMHIEDAVYGPLYFDYGGEDEPQGGPRGKYARKLEERIIRFAPDTILVLLKAAPEVILKRMKRCQRKNGILRSEDVELVSSLFEEEYENSLISNKITLDTSKSTPDKTMLDLLKQLDPVLTVSDRMRILAHEVFAADFVSRTGNK